MSELPSGWAELSLIEACKKITDGTHHSPPNAATGDFKYVTAKNIRRHGLDLANLTYVSAEVHRRIYERCPVERGDVLYIKDGATTGLAINNPLDEPFSLLSSVALLKPDRRFLDERYLRHWLNSPETLARMVGQMSGSAIKRLTLTTISAQLLPLPPLAEQRRIVAKLDALTARTARARAELNRIPPLAARYKQAVLAQAFSGELTAEWRQVAGSQTAVSPRASSDIRAKYRSNESDTSFSPPYDLPTAWAWLRLPEIGDMDRGKSRHRPRDDERLFGGPYPFIQTGDVRAADRYLTAYSRTYSEFGLDQSRLWPASTVCITIAANIAETAILGVDACFPDSVVGFTADSGRCIPEYVEYFIRTAKADLEQFAPATAQKNINLEVLASVRLPVAPLSEQAEIVCRIDRAFLEIDRMTTEATSARRLLDRLDQAVLAKAFRGELVPQDPTDEPASVLLERIKAEREAASKVNRGEKTYKIRRTKDSKIMTKTLEQVLAEAGDWISAQDAFRECGIGGASTTEEIEKIYAELRKIDKAGRLATEPVNDDRSRKLHDRLRLKVA